MNKRIYLISGLGADRRAFRKLVFPPEFEIVHLDWITAGPAESLESYAERLSQKIADDKPFYLIGLSFGGMLATEIARKLNPVHTILISSTPVYNELPWYYKFAGRLGIQKLIPLSLIKTGNTIGLRFLGAKTKEERDLLRQLVQSSDPAFIKWALSCILSWRNKERPSNMTHIHGSSDTILPLRYNRPDFVIANGSHFMVYANADEILKIIKEKLR